MNHCYSSEEAHQRFSSDDHHSDPASNIRAREQEAMDNETECMVGANYFVIDHQAYGFNQYFWVIFPVDDSCKLLRPVLAPTPGNTIILRDAILRTTSCGGLEYWEDQSQQWRPIELFPTYGEALSPDPSLLNSFMGIELEQGDEEKSFYNYGRPPTLESINQWVENRKALGAKSICPLNDCRQLLRRPHALKDHLFFRFGIKGFACGYAECDKSFSTKNNRDRHMKDCKAKGNHWAGH